MLKRFIVHLFLLIFLFSNAYAVANSSTWDVLDEDFIPAFDELISSLDSKVEISKEGLVFPGINTGTILIDHDNSAIQIVGYTHYRQYTFDDEFEYSFFAATVCSLVIHDSMSQYNIPVYFRTGGQTSVASKETLQKIAAMVASYIN